MDNNSNITNFINNNYTNWCLKDKLHDNTLNNSNILFYFILEKELHFSLLDLLNSKKLYLCKDGYIKNLDESEIYNQAYYIYNREEALELCKIFYEYVENKCKEAGFILSKLYCYFKLELKRCGNPTHLFTKEEVRGAMETADDRHNNKFVIDENGYVNIIQDVENGYTYPVGQREIFCAGNKYVGKYAEISDKEIDEYYSVLLKAWLKYLEKNSHCIIYEDDFMLKNSNNIENILERIKQYY